MTARAAGDSSRSPAADSPTMASHGSRRSALSLGDWTDMALKLLILGGTSEGRLLAERLAGDARWDALLSFAGRTQSLERPAVAHRVGGFGGVEGLVGFLRDGGYHALVDATHAFAAQMSAHAVAAADITGTPLLRVEKPAWQAQPGDRWLEVADMHAAARALGEAPRRVFLSVGRLEIAAFAAAPQHDYLVRAVDPFDPGLPRARVLCARGPFALDAELELLRDERIEVLVSKNAGTPATFAKLEAARALGLPVVMVARPALPPAEVVGTVEAAVQWLEALHGSASSRRGV
jgi:precorrin-6A/cobalt-precorrin-6A reductase